MKNLKKLMSVVLSVVMLLSFVVSTSAATFADVEETNSAYEAIEVLSALKILEGKEAGNFDPEANIKRSEFAAVICRAMNQESAALGGTAFTDVAPDHWAYNYIGWAAASEIVNGRGDGTFDPDANVSYNEAIAMIVRALGYEWYVNEFLGGFPSGHGRIASSYKIDAGVSVSNGNAAATRADVAQLLYNAFDAPLMDVQYISFEPSYAIFDGSKSVDGEKRTLLSYYSDIYKVRATVNTTYRNLDTLIASNGDKKIVIEPISLYGFDGLDVEEALNINNIVDKDGEFLGEITVIANNDDWTAFQGYVVNAYITVNAKDKAEIVAMVADNTSVEELVIEDAANLIVESSISGKKVTLEYYESADANKAKAVEMADAENVTVYVNSMEIGKLDGDGAVVFESLDDGYYSSVTLLGTDGEFNKIYLVSYEYGVVEEVDAELEVIETDANSYYLSADDTSDEFTYNIYKDGAKIGLADLAEGDLLNIVIGDKTLSGDVANATFVDIYVTNNVIESSVKYVDKDASDIEVYNIDGEDYYTIGGLSLKPGDTGKFFVTIDGYIYHAEFTSTYSDNYAFILDVAKTSTGFGESWQVKLLDKNNNVKVLNVKSSVYITDATYNKANFKTEASAANKQSDYFTALDATLTAADKATLVASIPERLVTFKEADGYISELVFAKAGSQDRDFDYVALNGTYGEKTGLLAGKELMDTTVLFNIPEAAAKEDGGVWALDADMIQIYAAASLKDKDSYTGFAYNVDEDNNTFGAAILTNDMGFAGNINALAVIMSISDGLDANNEPASLVKFFQGGEIKTKVITGTAYVGDNLAAYGAGDIFQYSVNGADEINKAYVVYNYGGYTNDGKVIPSELLKANDGDVDYYVGLVSGNTAKVLTFGSNALAWDLENGCTNVLFDTDLAKKNVSNAVKGYGTTSYIKDYSLNNKTGEFASDAYIAVVRTADDVIVDVVAYVYDRPAMDDATFVTTYLK